MSGRPGLRLIGEVDIRTHDALAAALESHGDAGELHLDVSGLDFIDVGGTAILVRATNPPAGPRRLVLHGAPVHLRRLLRLLWSPLPLIEMDGS